jgi:hypothetical protein
LKQRTDKELLAFDFTSHASPVDLAARVAPGLFYVSCALLCHRYDQVVLNVLGDQLLYDSMFATDFDRSDVFRASCFGGPRCQTLLIAISNVIRTSEPLAVDRLQNLGSYSFSFFALPWLQTEFVPVK